jgi:3-hydroxyisobutyrate dehydrogenase-like beta-hydroxyacid dehydrogenase
LATYQEFGIRGCASPAQALADANLVLCTVTADQAVTAVRQAAIHLERGAFWCDLNSCAPSSKRESAKIVDAAGGRYVDVAVMAPVHPKRNHPA